MRACREMRLSTVAVYSPSDRLSPHVQYADEAVPLGADQPTESYLRIDKMIEAAHRTKADTIHPGYGFLAENANFAKACQDSGILFVGPTADVIALMGEKTASRQAAKKAGVPIVPGTEKPLSDQLIGLELSELASAVGYPLFVKAVAGGGGKGMRLVHKHEELTSAVQSARSEAKSAFGNSEIYFERFVANARHIEVQVLADEYGRVVPFVERECSLQRRHQKVIEETPSPVVDVKTRQALAESAAALARGVGYTNAGTVEFLLDSAGKFYFLEMNTRLQVEHPVTEIVTGVDLVQWQLKIARGEELILDDIDTLVPRGHAIECRIYAEDPEVGFIPSPGLLTNLKVSAGPGVRDDSGVEIGYEVPVHYDSMLSKLVAWGSNRKQAIDRMARALTEYEVGGVKTTIPLFRWILCHPDFVEGKFDTNFLDRILATRDSEAFFNLSKEAEEVAILTAAIHTVLCREQKASNSADMDKASSAWKRAARLAGLRV